MRALLPLLVAVAASAGAYAQSCTTSWTNPAGGAWETATNWSDGVPDAADVACITLDGTYTVGQSSANRTVAGLVVGGASGTQRLTTFNEFTIAGDGLVRPNGVVEVLNRVPGAGDGVYTTGTLTVEGLLLYRGSDLLSDGGTLDVAPGGTLRIADNASAGSGAATFRIRGLLESVGTSTSRVAAVLDVQGGTLRAATGRLDINGGGLLHNATLEAPEEGALIRLGRPGVLTVTGTLSGTPGGRVALSDTRFEAGPGDATLAFGGTGLIFTGASGVQFSTITSAGGRFINTGLLTWEDQFAVAQAVVIENRGTLRSLEGVSLDQGARLLNRAGATWEIAASNALGFGDGTVENAGLILKTGAGSTHFGNGSGRLRNLPGAELRALNGRLDLAPPGSQTVPDGVTLTGTSSFWINYDLDIQGTVSPGTDAVPLAKLTFLRAYRPSQVAGSPRLVIDLDTGGRSDTLHVPVAAGVGNVRLAGALVLRARPGYTPAVGDRFAVFTTGNDITGAFSQIVADGAPSGVAFVTEISANGDTLIARAVEAAPGGPFQVSTTTPVGGGVRSLFLTGPGVVGVTAARLDCTECLDPEDYATIPATLVGSGTLVEARVDLTSPRVFGFYNLVVQRPGQPDVTVPVTVRPYVSYVRSLPSRVRGMRVRPPTGPGGGGYNWSHYELTNATNTDEPAYPFTLVVPEDPELVAFAVATGTPFATGSVFYESEASADRTAPAVLFARIAADETAPLSTGQRIAPEDVLFPEQTSTGPDDPRLPFGGERVFTVTSLQHVSFGRALATIELALRATPDASLQAYLAAVDAADAGALRRGIADALATRPRYVAGIPDLLSGVLGRTSTTVPTPPGLPDQVAPAFQRMLELAAWRLYADVEHAYRIDLAAAPASVRALLQAEYDAFAAASAASARIPIGNVCLDLLNISRERPPAGAPPPPSEVDIDHVIQCQVQQENSPPPPDEIDITTMPPPNNPFRNIARNVNTISRQIITAVGGPSPFGGSPFGGLSGGSCSPGGGGGGGGGAGGAGSCGPPEAPADPNDKITETTLRCQFGTVVVDGEEQTRCVRYFVPLARAADPVRYSVQFENLPQATAPAEFVTVTDTLDVDLNPATLRVLATSSDSTFSYTVAGQVVTFRFVGINLPPNVEEPEGQGFITFEVTPDAGLPEGTVIENRASIVFDVNPPILTPTVTHEIRASSDLAVVLDAPDQVEAGAPAAFRVLVTNLDGDDASDVTVTIAAGVPLTATPSTGTCTGAGPVTCTIPMLAGRSFEEIAVVMGTPPPGGYTLSASVASSAFDPFAANDTDAVELEVWAVSTEAGPGVLTEPTLAAPAPNPARGAVALRFGSPAAGRADVRVFDLLGREVAVVADGVPAEAGWTDLTWDASRAASGVYVVRYVTEWEGGAAVRTRRIVVVR